MHKFNTQGIVLARTDYGEAGRIITFLTPDYGKVKALAKGVRKSKSKLAAGVELFSVSDLGFLVGRGEINTLVSSRLVTHYGSIVKELERTNQAYEFLKMMNKATEEKPEAEYFELLKNSLQALDNSDIDLGLIQAWFSAQLLKLAGHQPNLTAQKDGQRLVAGQKYDFNFDSMSFEPGKTYDASQIKFLRLLFSGNPVHVLQKIEASERLSRALQPLIRNLISLFIVHYS